MTKQITNILLASSAALLMTLPLSAQTYQMAAKIPFAFQVNGQKMESGRYDVRREPNGISSLRGAKSGHLAYLNAQSGADNGKRANCLVFRRYGESYFLAEIWSPSASGTVLPVSRAEKEAIGSIKRQEAVIVLLNSRSKAD
jgi:hypothetical protein